MNWRLPLAIAGGIILTWSIIEWLYFGIIRPETGACTSSQIQSGSTCYNTWYYSLLGLLVGLAMLLGGLIGSAKGTGLEVILWSLSSIAIVPFILALIYFNLQVASGDQYVLQYGDIQYRIAFILEGLSLVGIVLFATAYGTYRYTRTTMEKLIPVEPPRQIAWAAEEEA